MRILVVDDEKKMVTLLKGALEHKGFEVEGVYGGQEALDRIATAPFDVVLSNGSEVAGVVTGPEGTPRTGLRVRLSSASLGGSRESRFSNTGSRKSAASAIISSFSGWSSGR